MMLASARLYRSFALTPLRGLAAVAVALSLTGCSSPCSVFSAEDSEFIDIQLPVTVESSGDTSKWTLVNEAGRSSALDEADYQAARHFLIEDISQTGGGATWVMYEPKFTMGAPHIAVQLAGSFRPGDVVQVTLASGISSGFVGPAPEGARGIEVYAHTNDEDWLASSVSGTLEVVAVAPLRLRLDLVATNKPGDEVRIRGEMTAALSHRTCN